MLRALCSAVLCGTSASSVNLVLQSQYNNFSFNLSPKDLLKKNKNNLMKSIHDSIQFSFIDKTQNYKEHFPHWASYMIYNAFVREAEGQ